MVHEAQTAGIAAVRPGAGEVDRACRAVVDGARFGGAFGHGAWHGVGLEVHDRPCARGEPAPEDNEVLRAGMTLTVEPGICLPGVGGARVEDTLIVTDDGSERLTAVPKEWRAL